MCPNQSCAHRATCVYSGINTCPTKESRLTIQEVYDHIVLVLQASILVIAALFPIVNPIGSAAVFLAMVDTIDAELQRKLVNRITMYSFFLLFLSMLCGGKILSFFGISLYSVQIGGGIIVAANGWNLLTQDAKKDQGAICNPEEVLNQAFYPYTLPITVGPGSISVAVALGAHLPRNCMRSPLYPPGFSPLRFLAHW